MISIRLRGLSKLMVLLRDFRQGLHGLVPLFSGLLGTGRRLILRQPSAIPPGEGHSAWLGCRSGGSTLLRRQRWGRRARRPGRDAGAHQPQLSTQFLRRQKDDGLNGAGHGSVTEAGLQGRFRRVRCRLKPGRVAGLDFGAQRRAMKSAKRGMASRRNYNGKSDNGGLDFRKPRLAEMITNRWDIVMPIGRPPEEVCRILRVERGNRIRYASPSYRDTQTCPPISDGAHGKPWVFRFKDLRAWWSDAHCYRLGGVESGAPETWVPQPKPCWFTDLGCLAVDRGTNQPNVLFDPKSSESKVPYFSRGWRDDALQRAYLETMSSQPLKARVPQSVCWPSTSALTPLKAKAAFASQCADRVP